MTEPITDDEVNGLIETYTQHLVNDIKTSEQVINGAIITQLVMLEYNHSSGKDDRTTGADDLERNIKLAASVSA